MIPRPHANPGNPQSTECAVGRRSSRYIQDLPRGTTGLKIAAVRYPDDTGVVLTVTLLSTKAEQSGTQKGFNSQFVVQRGKEPILNMHSLGGSDYGMDRGVKLGSLPILRNGDPALFLG